MDSEQQKVNESNSVIDIYRKNLTDYYQVIDCIVTNLRKRFSLESLKMASSIDEFHKLNYDQSIYFIEHYKVNILMFKILLIFVKFITYFFSF